MRFATSLALAAALAFGAQSLPQAVGQSANPNTGHRTWPAVGNWQVFLGTLPDGQRTCTVQHNAVQMNGYGYTAGFSFSGHESRFSMIHIGPGAPIATVISLQADGQPVASFAAISSGSSFGPGNNLHPLNAIMPGNSYIRVVSPALSRAREMTVTAGNQTYSFDLAGFNRMTPELVECARLAAQP